MADVCLQQPEVVMTWPWAGLVISIIDVDIIDDTFDISISTILSYKSIDRGIDDTLLAFLSTLHRFDTSQPVSYTHLTLPTNREV